MPRTQIPIMASFDDTYPEEWTYKQGSCDPSIIDLKGPAKDVENVSRAIAHIHADDIIWEEGQHSERFPFQLYTREGEEVNTNNISISSLSRNAYSLFAGTSKGKVGISYTIEQCFERCLKWGAA